MLINYTSPFDLQYTLESGQSFRWIKEYLDDELFYQGVIGNDIICLSQKHNTIKLESSSNSESIKNHIIDYLKLDENLDEVYRYISKDIYINSAIEKYRGMKILRQDPWECLISFICSSNSNIKRISKNIEDISIEYGNKITFNGFERYSFPSAKMLSNTTEQKLRNLGLGFRAPYVLEAAKIIALEQINLKKLRSINYEEALDILIKIPGVGDKVANCVLLFSLDQTEAFPVDVWIQRVLKEKYFNIQEKTNIIKVRMKAQKYFRKHAGYANQYLFHNRRLFKL
ncbi:MAG: 8-oxoguanine DNA glycosylase [Chloroflexi bacterium]|nr:8-oxoguanine DNA glycosylase [Chloroflexota bacterium]